MSGQYNSPYQQPQYGYNPQQQQYPSYGQPPQQYGQPPQGYYAPPPQGSFAPPQQGSYAQAPPPVFGQPPTHSSQTPHFPHPDAKYPDEKALHQPPPAGQAGAPGPQFITFKFSGVKKTIRDSHVTDPWGRTVLTIASTKKESTLHNMHGQVLAVIEWNHSLPKIRYRGSEAKSKEFLPLERKIRGMTHEGQMYGWRGSPDGMNVELYHPSAPQKCLAYWHNEENVIHMEASPEVCESAGMLDMCLMAVFLMTCGTQLEEHGSGGPNFVLINAISALINAA
ncbi:hypothetical protein C8F04DRAFT_1250008 [Mycena alexandri]|uniref:DUF6593 domain-containing protein n=1 Tax=Mycena alexandri TaxID=1745969 RepID=A0AAD6TG60_9AGAR|nr:hypothetical protein C8F04DRAFT_1250008 [Mycena alexandri]